MSVYYDVKEYLEIREIAGGKRSDGRFGKETSGMARMENTG